MTVRRQLDKLKGAVTARTGGPGGPRVWVVLPARDDDPLVEPVVNGPVVVVPRGWTPDQIDAFLTTWAVRPPDKIILGADPLALV